jgi:hypothetical protein
MPQHTIRMATPALARPAGVKRADHKAPTLHRDAHRERTAAQKGRGQADPPASAAVEGLASTVRASRRPLCKSGEVLRLRFHPSTRTPLLAKGVRAARLPLETFSQRRPGAKENAMKKPRNSKNAIATSRTRHRLRGLPVHPARSADKPFYGVRVAAEQDGRFVKYSPLYHCKTEGEGRALAQQIAKDRGIKVVVRAAPERPVIRPPEPVPVDDGKPMPF